MSSAVDNAAEVHHVRLDELPQPQARLVTREPDRLPGYALDEADVVVAAGATVGQDGMHELERLAERLGAAVAGDRAACAAGVVPRSRQVGLLGRAVAPRLYLGVETSGDFEHLTGIVKANVITAISADAASPLLEAADVGIVGDWRDVLPSLADALAGTL
jgi:electron transfer flavoprotein alpha subunit